MQLHRNILDDILGREGITLTADQERAVEAFLHFYSSKVPYSAFILRGAAGTGKTFLIRILQQFLEQMGRQVALLAPTGRAAKVITRRTHRYASTIHRYIYSPLDHPSGGVFFSLKENRDNEKVVYVVDEASMVGDRSGDQDGNGLLTDLLRFVYSHDTFRKLILVGDDAQLPPVGSQTSPALDAAYLRKEFHLTLHEADLQEIMRQEEASAIVTWANEVRVAMEAGIAPVMEQRWGREVQVLDQPYEVLDTFVGLYEQDNPDKVVLLTYSNRMATEINRAIRRQLFETEEKVIRGEALMVVRNNYAWGIKSFPFIANGEMGFVQDVHRETLEERYGMTFVDVDMEFADLSERPVVLTCKVMLDLLESNKPQLEYGDLQRVALLRRRELEGEGKPFDFRKDPYLNALQVKYGYAVTGHKAQGGQWQQVLVAFEPMYQGMNLKEYLRWTYTAFTRAEDKLYLMGCPFLQREY